MFQRSTGRAALIAAIAALAVPAFAQGGPGGFGGPPPPGVEFGPGMGRRPMGPPSVARTPADALADALELSDTQILKIVHIQVALRKQSEALRPPRGGQRPDPSVMQANGEKMRALEQKAESDITALLSASQKTKLETFMQMQQQRGGPGGRGGFGGPGGGRGFGGPGGGRGFGGPPPGGPDGPPPFEE